MNKESTTKFDINAQIDNGPFTIAQIIIIAVCVCLNILDGFDITTMAVSKTAIAKDLSLSASQLGFLDGIALAGMCIGAMFLGSLSDLIGRRRVILYSIGSIAITMLLTAYVQNFTQFFIFRMLTGLGVGAMLASIPAIASEYSPERFKGLAVTIATVGYPAGAILGGTFGPDLIASWGWQGVFFFGAAATAIITVISFVLLPESLQFLLSKQPHNALTQTNKVLHRLKQPALQELPKISNNQKTGLSSTIFEIFNNLGGLFKGHLLTKTLLLWVIFFLSLVTLYFMMSWIPYMVEHAGHSREQGGQAFSLFNIGAIIGVIFLGSLSTKMPLSTSVAIFLICAAILMVVFANTSSDVFGLMALILIIGIFMQGGYTGLYACAAKIYPCEIRATGVGWAIGVGRLGAVLGPAIAGVLIDHGISMQTNFMLFAVPLLLSGIIAYSLKLK